MRILMILLPLIASLLILASGSYCTTAMQIAYISVTKKELAMAFYILLATSISINLVLLAKR